MGFFIRKAFKAGPVRINLSKGGVGVSAGVTGARLGLNKNGAYVYGGRHGLYYRESLNPKKGKRSSRRGRNGIVTLFSDTGVTYPSLYDLIEIYDYPELIDRSGLHKKIWVWLLFLISLSTPLYFFETPEFWGVPGIVALFILFAFWKDRRWRKNGTAMVQNLAEEFENNPESFTLNKMNEFIDKAPVKYINRFLPDLYCVLIQIALEYEDNPHIFAFNKFEKQIPVADEFILQTKKAILTRRLDAFLEDHLLTKEEEASIKNLIGKLHLDDDFIFEELQYLDLASSIRKEMESNLTEINSSVPLVMGETCFGEFDEVRILEERVLNRYQKDRVKYKEIGYQTQLEGKLVLTDRRLIIVGNGSREYRLNQVLDVITDLETNIIELVIANRKNPVYLTSPQPILISARIEKVIEEIHSLETA